MTEGLQVAVMVRATKATRDDMIDIGRRHYLGGMDEKGIHTQRVGTEVHGPLLSPPCPIAALRCGLSHIISAQLLRMTDGACVCACLDDTNASLIATRLGCTCRHGLPHHPTT